LAEAIIRTIMTTNLTDKNGTVTSPKKDGVKMAGPAKPAQAKKEGPFQKLSKYLQEVQIELKKTTWPDKAKLTASTKVVLGTITAIGLYLYGIDLLLNQVMRLIIHSPGH
jgi:preprotein translocase subunit SecE